MAEMLVDSTKLDACLDAEADAIRAKTGDSNDLMFDFANDKGFADAIAAIPSGGGEVWAYHKIELTLTASTSMHIILHQYIKYAYQWRITPNSESTSTDTIAAGMCFHDGLTGTTMSGTLLPSVTTPLGVTISVGVYGQWLINDQTYNSTRWRGNVNLKPAGDYILEFYGVAK